MSVLVLVGRKCTLAASRAAPWWVTLSVRILWWVIEKRRDRQTDARLCLPLDAASVISDVRCINNFAIISWLFSAAVQFDADARWRQWCSFVVASDSTRWRSHVDRVHQQDLWWQCLSSAVSQWIHHLCHVSQTTFVLLTLPDSVGRVSFPLKNYYFSHFWPMCCFYRHFGVWIFVKFRK